MQSLKPKGKVQGAGSGAVHSPAAELEEELIQSAPKGDQDKMRVLRSRLKRLSSNLPDLGIGAAGSKQSKSATSWKESALVLELEEGLWGHFLQGSHGLQLSIDKVCLLYSAIQSGGLQCETSLSWAPLLSCKQHV